MALRVRVLADGEAGLRTAAVAATQRVSEFWVRRLEQRRRETEEIAPGRPGPRRPRIRRPSRVALRPLWRRLGELERTFGKSPAGRRAAPPGWGGRAGRVAARRGPGPTVFLDETGTSTALTRLYGWRPRDQSVVGATPWGHGKTTTFLSALREDGCTAPWVLDGVIAGALFRAYLEQPVAPNATIGRSGDPG
jgi:hypothetical protein